MKAPAEQIESSVVKDHPDQEPILMVAAKGGLFNFLGTAGGKVFGLLLQILVSRYYGADEYGIFVTGILACHVLQILAAGGLQKGGMRFLAIAHETRDYAMMLDALKTSVLFPILFSVVVLSLAYVFAPFVAITCFNNEAMVGVLRQFAWAVPFFALLRITSDLSRAFKTTKYAVLIENFMFYVLHILIFIILHLLGYGFASAVHSFIVTSIICSIVMLFTVWRQLHWFKAFLPRHLLPIKRDLFPKNWRPILAYSLPLTPFGLLVIGGNSMDIIMLNILTDSSGVGEYAAAGRWIMFFGMIAVSLELIFGPLIAGQIGLKNQDQLNLLYRTATRWSFFLTLPLAIFQILAKEPLMAIFGKEFTAYGPSVLTILVLGSLFNSVAGCAGMLLTMSEHQYIELGCLSINLILSMLFSFLLIPRYGVIGAAFATAASNALVVALRIAIIHRYMLVHPFSTHLVLPVLGGLAIVALGCSTSSTITLSAVFQFALAFAGACGSLAITLAFGLDKVDRQLWCMIRGRLSRRPSQAPTGG